MITYKEFEVINTMLKANEAIDDLPEYVYSNIHYYAFKSKAIPHRNKSMRICG